MTSAPLLVADIGGTNARFAIAEREGKRAKILHREVMRAEDFEHLADAAKAFLESWSGAAPKQGVFAVAGPVDVEEVVFTNSPWRFRPDDLAKQIGCGGALRIINDFAAMSRGAVAAPDAELSLVEEGEGLPGAPIAVLGPGTGLGLGIVIETRGHVSVIATEGGHVAFAPQDEKEIEVLRFIQREHAFVSYERVLSGRGLVNLHRALCVINGATRVSLRPDEITSAAMERTLPIAREATEMFCAILGTYAGDAAVMTGARGGIILAGGILPKIEPILRESRFNARFVERDPMRAYLEAIPVRLLNSDTAALVGAALMAD
ncbi:MAG: glucokinase [Pseudomonadota bacterium]|nr:glucokinase [Pseudomonadota bacterium]